MTPTGPTATAQISPLRLRRRHSSSLLVAPHAIPIGSMAIMTASLVKTCRDATFVVDKYVRDSGAC